MTCIFCRIVAGDAVASVVYEDAETFAFLDLRQLTRGHTLVVPRRHVRDIFELDDETGAALMRTAARIARAARAAFAPDGINVWQSNGVAAGQEVFHLHLHVLPRSAGDGMLRVYGDDAPEYPSRPELDALASELRGVIEL